MASGERHDPRHVDRRDEGQRRQRRVTQWAAFGAAALSVAFGWVFAQGTSASAEGSSGTDPDVKSSQEAKPKSSAKPSKSAKAKPSKSAKASADDAEEDADDEEANDEEANDEEANDEADELDNEQTATDLEPPAEAPEATTSQESDASSGGS